MLITEMEDQTLYEAVRNIPIISLKVPINYTKAFKKKLARPTIITQAEGFKNVLEDLPIIIRKDELIVGTFDEDVPVAIPRMEATGLRILKELDILPNRDVNPIRVREEDKRIFREELAPFWEENRIENYAKQIAPEEVFEGLYSGGAYVSTETGGIAHAVINYPRLLSMGFNKYLESIENHLKDLIPSIARDPEASEKIAFYKAMRTVLSSLINYSKKYSLKAEELAQKEEDSIRKKELLQIAEVCKWVPANPPRNLHEAIQFIWLIHMALHIENFEHGISFGRLDQCLQPYYDGNSEFAVRLLMNLFLKTNEIIALYDTVATQYFGGMATTQNFLIGGMNVKAEDATNEMTYLILDAYEKASVPSPNLVIRCHENTPSQLYQRMAEFLAHGKNIFGLYHDEVVMKALMKYGISEEEARDYGVVGCVGLSTSGNAYDNTGAIFLSLAKALECALGTDKTIINEIIKKDFHPEQFNSMDEVLNAYKESLHSIMRLSIIAANAYQEAHKILKPTPLMSLCIDGCFEQGKDVNSGPAEHNFSGLHITGFSDVVNSIAAIDHAVFKEKKVSMNELITVLKKNFRKNKELKNYLKNKCPKYGSDDDSADKYAKAIAENTKAAIDGFISARGDPYRLGIHAMTTHNGFGIFTGALPSGRKKGKPLTRDLAPGTTGEKGLTAAIKSITKIDHTLFANGLACTLNINPEVAKIENGKILESLLRSYFKLGGSHIQFNAISPETLKDAQKNPDEYFDLMVRVSGYSARFIDLPKGVQDDIIGRYCYTNF
jgi:formate C-acetyltransferase